MTTLGRPALPEGAGGKFQSGQVVWHADRSSGTGGGSLVDRLPGEPGAPDGPESRPSGRRQVLAPFPVCHECGVLMGGMPFGQACNFVTGATLPDLA